MSDAYDPQAARRRWDERYAAAEGELWGRPPNATVAEVVEGLELDGGAALDLGAGEGRNAIWLAQRGFRVTAVDLSPVALEQLRRWAADAGVEVEAVEADLASWTPEPASADLVVVSFLHLPQPQRGRVHRAAAAAVRPGGWLVLIAHARSNLEHGVGGPPDPGLLPTADELAEELGALRLDRLEVIERPVEGEPRPALDLVAVGQRL